MKENENLEMVRIYVEKLEGKDLQHIINVERENGSYVLESISKSVNNNKLICRLKKIITPINEYNRKIISQFLNIYI